MRDARGAGCAHVGVALFCVREEAMHVCRVRRRDADPGLPLAAPVGAHDTAAQNSRPDAGALSAGSAGARRGAPAGGAATIRVIPGAAARGWASDGRHGASVAACLPTLRTAGRHGRDSLGCVMHV